MRLVDLTGRHFGKLAVLKKAANKHGRVRWLCLCECGREKEMPANSLISGNAQSCGCVNRERIRNLHSNDLEGRKLGKLLVLSRHSPMNGQKRVYWNCLCDCGKETKVWSSHLIQGKTKSCGCLRLEKMPAGWSGLTRLWCSYKAAANNRGLCFELTRDDMHDITQQDCIYCGRKPLSISHAKGKSDNGRYMYNGIDRVDNDIGYVRENCVACCGRCNVAKASMSLEEFKNWISLVYSKIHSKAIETVNER